MDEVTVVGKGTIEALQIVEYDNGKFFKLDFSLDRSRKSLQLKLFLKRVP